MKSITILTKPVQVNKKFSVIRGRMFLSKEYRDTKEAMEWEITAQYKGKIIEEDVCMNVLFYYGDSRKRDIDAYLKILLDSMTGIVYTDDSQINEMHVFKEVDKDNPRTVIQIL